MLRETSSWKQQLSARFSLVEIRRNKRKSPLGRTWVHPRGRFDVSRVHPARFELATSGFVNRRSIQLNYGCRTTDVSLFAKTIKELDGRLARLISGQLDDL